jgi:very-short-patch-repair endonuclease
MSQHEVRLSTWLAAHHGVVSRTWLVASGYSPGRIRSLLESGRLVEVHRGVYQALSAARTHQQSMVGLVMMSGGVISHGSAGQLWGFRKLASIRLTHLTIPVGRRLRLANAVVHTSSDLSDRDIVRRADGIVVTSPPRTVFDLAGYVSAADLESIVEQGLDRRLFTFTTLHAAGARLAKSGRRGSLRFNAVLGDRSAGQRPVASDYELRLARALERIGLPRFERQFPLRLPTGDLIHPDLADPTRRFLVEVDHTAWHAGEANAYDRWRDRQVHLLGWHSERVSDRDIDRNLDQTVAELAQLYHGRPSFRPGESTGCFSDRKRNAG